VAIEAGYHLDKLKISFRSPSSWEFPAFVEETTPLILRSAMVYGRSSHNKNGIGGPRETAYEGEEIVPSVFSLVAIILFSWISNSSQQRIYR